MEAEAVMLQRSTPINRGGFMRGEALAWARLFDRRYIDRTLVGTVVMFFQRECPELIALETVHNSHLSQSGAVLMPCCITARC
jgi:hypothetical protein